MDDVRARALFDQHTQKYGGLADLTILRAELAEPFQFLRTWFKDGLEPLPEVFFEVMGSISAVQACAFRREGTQFIGVTLALILEGHDSALRLAGSPAIRQMVEPEEFDQNDAAVGFFFLSHLFVVSHELAHHLAGHTQRWEASAIGVVEFGPDAKAGPTSHANEAVADGLAIQFALAGLLVPGSFRAAPSLMFRLQSRDESATDRALLTAFLLSVAAFFIQRQPGPVSVKTLLRRTHPAPVTRMVLIADHIRDWLAERGKTELAEWFRPNVFQAILTEAFVALGIDRNRWQPEIAFGQSSEARAYMSRIKDGIDLQRNKRLLLNVRR